MKKTKAKAIVLACVVVVLVPVAASLRGSSISQAAYSLIEQAGAALTARPILNFPVNMVCVDNAGANRTDCTPSGIGGTEYQTVQNNGTPLTQQPVLNFTSNITCVNNAGNTSTDCSAASGGTTGSGLITYAALSVVLSSGTSAVFVPLGGDGLGSATETNVQMKVQSIAQFSNACVNLSAAPGAGNSLTVRLRNNAANTSIVMTVADTATSACDSTHTVTNASGDLLDWSLVPSGTIVAFNPNVMISSQSGISSSSGGGATRGTFASRPASPASGSTYFSTDIPVISEWNGSTWADWAFGRQVTLPASTTFTNFNIGSSVVTTNGIMNLSVAAHSGDNLVGQQVALPATPFTLDAAFGPNVLTQNNYIYGVGVTDGTKLVTFGFFNQGTPQILVSNWTNATTFSSNPIAAVSNFNGSSLFHLRWADNGTNVTFSWSTDGVFFQTLGTLGRTAFLTPTNLMWFVDVNNTSFGMNLTAFNWFVH